MWLRCAAVLTLCTSHSVLPALADVEDADTNQRWALGDDVVCLQTATRVLRAEALVQNASLTRAPEHERARSTAQVASRFAVIGVLDVMLPLSLGDHIMHQGQGVYEIKTPPLLRSAVEAWTVLACAGLALAPCLVAWYGLPLPETRRKDFRAGELSWGVLLTSVGVVAIGCTTSAQFLPNMPMMATEWGISDETMGLSVQATNLTKGFAFLLMGPLSDRVGRRPVLLATLSLLLTGTLCNAFAGSFEWFILGRFLQGCGEACFVIISAAVRDHYDDVTERLRVWAGLFVAVVFAPMMAPIFGGVLGAWFGWRCSFYVMAGITLALLLASYACFEETLSGVNSEPVDTEHLLHAVFGDGRWLMLITSGILKATFDMLIACNSFVFEDFGMSSDESGFLIAFVEVAGLAGSYLPGLLTHWFTPDQSTRSSMTTLVAIATAFILFARLLSSLWPYVAALCTLQLFVYTPILALETLYMQPQNGSAGFASGVWYSSMFVFGALASLPGIAMQSALGAPGVMYGLALLVLTANLFFWSGTWMSYIK